MSLRGTAVFIRMASRPIPRVSRMMKVAREMGYDPVFCGAFRQKNLPRDDRWEGWRIVRVGPYFPLLNGSRPLLYLKSTLFFNRAAYRFLRAARPEIVHASDFETMPAAVLYRWIFKARLVYNIHDNLAQRYNLPRLLARGLNYLEAAFVKLSDMAAVPEDFRRGALPGWCRNNVSIIRNTPEDPGYSAPVWEGDGTIRIFFGGWLDWGRGLDALIRLAEKDPRIDLRLAGEGSPEIVERLRSHPRLRYLGFLDHEQVIEETRSCHFVPVLYDPIRIINRFAASNKLAEALAVGRPVMLNEEMAIASSLGNRSCIIVAGYSEMAEVGERLRSLVSDRENYMSASREARWLYQQHYAWEPVKREIHSVLGGADSCNGGGSGMNRDSS